MTEEDHGYQHGERKTKTHDEILKLFEELDPLEEHVRHLDLSQDFQPLPDTGTPTQIGELQPRPEEEPEKKKHRIKILRRLRERKTPEEQKQKMKRVFFRRRKRERELSGEMPSEREEMLHPSASVEPYGTFTLRIDDEGNLVGFPLRIPSPKPEKKARHLFPFRKKRTGETETEGAGAEETKSGLKAKLSRLIPRRRGARSEREGGRFSRLKGVFSRVRRSRGKEE